MLYFSFNNYAILKIDQFQQNLNVSTKIKNRVKERVIMSHLNWFSGGNERGKQAETIITDLLDGLKTNTGNKALQQVLESYLEELEQKNTSVPLILSRMNLDISKAITIDGVPLSDYQSKKLKTLTSISNIRYGY